MYPVQKVLREDYEMKAFSRSQELYEQAIRVTPGSQSNLGRFVKDLKPLFITSGQGAHLYDVDGNDYIDYIAGMGPGILGHGNEEYLKALKEQLSALYYLSGIFQSTMEIELAEKFARLVPCAERVRFGVTGSEIVQLAIRLARAYTKRPYFIRFEGHYHGWLDNVMGGLVDDQLKEKPFPVVSDSDPRRCEGMNPDAYGESFLLPWNEIDILEGVLEKYGEEVAMIHMEPILCNAGCCLPRPGYLERVRELCTRYGIVLSFDEIITGFRVGLNSAQGKLGVTPDIATFGKAMAAGFPIAAVAGRKEILDLIIQQRVVGAGTFNSNPVGFAAGIATLNILERDNGAFYKRIDKIQSRLVNGLREISRRHGLAMLIQGPTGVFWTEFMDKEIAYSVRDLMGADAEKQTRFRTLLREEGILSYRGRWYVSGGLTDGDVDKTLECVDRALSRL
ncbi:aspartate aminotransferase family protein [Chloroflexota bacterium]